MISRRLFLKAAASLAALPALPAAAVLQPEALPVAAWSSKFRIYSMGGSLLAEADALVERVGAGYLLPQGFSFQVLQTGTARRFEWELPNGETLHGDIGTNPHAEFRMTSDKLSVGGMITFTDGGYNVP